MEKFSDSVLIFAGLDPSGGAGLSADIESINQFGVIALPIATILTAQNTAKITTIDVVKSSTIKEQFELLNNDIDFRIIKIGLIGSVEQVDIISQFIKNKKEIKVILDPIILASSGKKLTNEQTLIKIKKLIPLCEIITPNKLELELLAPNLDERSAVANLKCKWTLITTASKGDDKVEHRLYKGVNLYKKFYYKKLNRKYHGSGCTLASSISALLAIGFDVDNACEKALEYSYQTLLNAKKIGKIQYNPIRSRPK